MMSGDIGVVDSSLIKPPLLTFCVEFESLLYRSDGRQHRQPVDSGFDVGRSAKLICQHFTYSGNLVFRRDDEGNHGRTIPGGKTLTLHTFQFQELQSSCCIVSTYGFRMSVTSYFSKSLHSTPCFPGLAWQPMRSFHFPL